MSDEIWKDVDGYEGMYQVSTIGRIRSKKRGGLKILSHGYNADGYAQMPLSHIAKRTTYKVHRLVALHFISNPENKPQVNHINGIKDDNRAENLEWVTAKENCFHADINGLRPPLKGVRNGQSKLKESDVIEIRELLKQKNTLSNIASKYGVHLSLISLIKTNKNWTHVI